MPTQQYNPAKEVNRAMVEAKDHIREIKELLGSIQYHHGMVLTALNRVEGGLENSEKMMADLTRDYTAVAKIVEQNKVALDKTTPIDAQDDALVEAEDAAFEYKRKLDIFRDMLSEIDETLSINIDILWGFMKDMGGHFGDVAVEASNVKAAFEHLQK